MSDDWCVVSLILLLCNRELAILCVTICPNWNLHWMRIVWKRARMLPKARPIHWPLFVLGSKRPIHHVAPVELPPSNAMLMYGKWGPTRLCGATMKKILEYNQELFSHHQYACYCHQWCDCAKIWQKTEVSQISPQKAPATTAYYYLKLAKNNLTCLDFQLKLRPFEGHVNKC